MTDAGFTIVPDATARAMHGAGGAEWAMLCAIARQARMSVRWRMRDLDEWAGMTSGRIGRKARRQLVERGVIVRDEHGWTLAEKPDPQVRGTYRSGGPIGPVTGPTGPQNRTHRSGGPTGPADLQVRKTGPTGPPAPYIGSRSSNDPSSVTVAVDRPGPTPTPSAPVEEEGGTLVTRSMVASFDLVADVMEVAFRAKPSDAIRSTLTAGGWTYQADEGQWTAPHDERAHAALVSVAPWVDAWAHVRAVRRCRAEGIDEGRAAELVRVLQREQAKHPDRPDIVRAECEAWLKRQRRPVVTSTKPEPVGEGLTLADDLDEPPGWAGLVGFLGARFGEAGYNVTLTRLEAGEAWLRCADEVEAMVVRKSYGSMIRSHLDADELVLTWSGDDGEERVERGRDAA